MPLRRNEKISVKGSLDKGEITSNNLLEYQLGETPPNETKTRVKPIKTQNNKKITLVYKLIILVLYMGNTVIIPSISLNSPN